jgi:hypothetical protein
VQFHGSFADFEWGQLWSAKAENTCKVFAWLVLQNRLWKADRIKHGGQANAICQLCRSSAKSALHMIATCSYSVRVWRGLESWLSVAIQPLPG